MNVAASASAGSSLGSALPPWLHDTLLGYGDPAAAHYTSLPPPPGPGEGALALSSSPWRQLGEIDFRDTFLSAAHVGSSFPGREVAFVSEETGEPLDPGSPLAAPPYRLRFAPGPAPGAPERVTVIPYSPPPAGPFPEDAPRANSIEFTPVQVEAIRAAVNPGLTLVVGPPGTGKTDTAVAAIAALVANFPGQRVLVVTHSNQALNDLFAKLVARDVPEHTMLRLGSGEKDLATAGGGALAGRDFSKWGRVAHALARRSVLLGEVQRLAASLGVPGDVGYTCETAEYFALYHVTSRIEAFRARWGVPAPPGAGGELGGGAAAGGFSAVSGAAAAGAGGGADATVTGSLEAVVGTSAAAAAARTAYRRATEGRMGGVAGGDVAASFPFAPFFSSAPGGLQALFPAGCSGWHALASSESCFAHLSSVFAELASYRAFELLRTQKARVEYMLTKQARVIAMTCTHAALIRPQLVELGFRYDSLVMEEAGQVTEVETLIPMLLQQAGGGGKRGTGELPRLKRVVLIGDHQQLPPVVQCQALQRYARLDQSLFARLVRLGVPAVQLNAQGRMRPQLARLYNWRYAGLGDLPSAAARPEFVSANAGMCREAQLIDVPDYGGAGESTPLPHFYQVRTRRRRRPRHTDCACVRFSRTSPPTHACHCPPPLSPLFLRSESGRGRVHRGRVPVPPPGGVAVLLHRHPHHVQRAGGAAAGRAAPSVRPLRRLRRTRPSGDGGQVPGLPGGHRPPLPRAHARGGAPAGRAAPHRRHVPRAAWPVRLRPGSAVCGLPGAAAVPVATDAGSAHPPAAAGGGAVAHRAAALRRGPVGRGGRRGVLGRRAHPRDRRGRGPHGSHRGAHPGRADGGCRGGGTGAPAPARQRARYRRRGRRSQGPRRAAQAGRGRGPRPGGGSPRARPGRRGRRRRRRCSCGGGRRVSARWRLNFNVRVLATIASRPGRSPRFHRQLVAFHIYSKYPRSDPKRNLWIQ